MKFDSQPEHDFNMSFIKVWDLMKVTPGVIKSKQKRYNYIGGFTVPSNIYDGKFLRNYQLATSIRKLIN